MLSPPLLLHKDIDEQSNIRKYTIGVDGYGVKYDSHSSTIADEFLAKLRLRMLSYFSLTYCLDRSANRLMKI